MSTKRDNLETSDDNEEVKRLKIDHEHPAVASDPTAEVQGVLEKDVGITEFVGTHRGFSATIKKRYSDFLVNEINPAGEIVHLTNLTAPPEAKIDPQEEEEGIVSEEKLQELENLMNDETSDNVVIDVTTLDKDERRKMHLLIKRRFPELESQTRDDGDRKVIIIKRKKDVKNKRNNLDWPHDRANYTHFVLYKENTDTMEAIKMIASVLKMKPSAFSFCGTKDKRGKTCQIVSVYRLSANKLIGLNKRDWNIAIGNINYLPNPVKLGDLAGNHFALVLRDVKGSSEDIKQAVESLSSKGFVNYYGMQRFGTTTVPTHEVGKALLKENYEEAVDLILKPRCGGSEYLSACREEWMKTKDANKALSKLYAKGLYSLEGNLLEGLSKHGSKGWKAALQYIPRNTRLMYVHSYQSYVWNRVVSRRIQKFGLNPIEGDLVITRDAAENLSEDDDSKKPDPSFVTDAENASVFDIVLPVPGHSIKYPNNEISDWYKEILAEDSLSMDCFKNSSKSFSVSGCYRHMIVLPKNMQSSELKYSDPKVPLVLSDLDVLKNRTLEEQKGEETFTAIKIEFSLPSSCYATMAVRELLKADTTEWTFKQKMMEGKKE